MAEVNECNEMKPLLPVEQVKKNTFHQSSREGSSTNLLHDSSTFDYRYSVSSTEDSETESEVSYLGELRCNGLNECTLDKYSELNISGNDSVLESKLVNNLNDDQLAKYDLNENKAIDLMLEPNEINMINEIKNETMAINNLQLQFLKEKGELSSVDIYKLRNKCFGEDLEKILSFIFENRENEHISLNKNTKKVNYNIINVMTDKELENESKLIVNKILDDALEKISHDIVIRQINDISLSENRDIYGSDDDEMKLCFAGLPTDVNYNHSFASMKARQYESLLKQSGQSIILSEEVKARMLKFSEKEKELGEISTTSESSYDSADALSRDCSTDSYDTSSPSYYSTSSSSSFYCSDCSYTTVSSCSKGTESCEDHNCYDHGCWLTDSNSDESEDESCGESDDLSDDETRDSDSDSDDYETESSSGEYSSYYETESSSDYTTSESEVIRERQSLCDMKKIKRKVCNESFARNSNYDLADRGLMRTVDGSIIEVIPYIF